MFDTSLNIQDLWSQLASNQATSGIGARMASVRAKLKISQARAAQILEIADKSYKNYELELRDLPIPVAQRFCQQFDTNLAWLIEGESSAASEEIVQFIGDTIEAVMTEALDRGIELTPTLIRKISCTCYKNSIRNGTEPKKEVATVFEFLSEIV